MPVYYVHANECPCGVYNANNAQQARSLASIDAGYASEREMASRLGALSELTATAINTEALIAAIDASSPDCVYQDESGAVTVGDTRYDDWNDIARILDKDVLDFAHNQ